MAFFGKEYKFEKQENYEEFVNALGLTPEQTQSFINYRPTQKFVQNGDSYTFTTISPQATKELVFKAGVPFDEKVIDRTCKTTFTFDGNTVKQVQKYDDGVELNVNREFAGDNLTVTITATKWDGVARRYYKA